MCATTQPPLPQRKPVFAPAYAVALRQRQGTPACARHLQQWSGGRYDSFTLERSMTVQSTHWPRASVSEPGICIACSYNTLESRRSQWRRRAGCSFAKRLLDETDLPITQIALAAGFGSLRRFNDAFQLSYRRSPRELRKRRSDAAAARGDEVVLRLAFRPPYDWIHVRNFLAVRALPGVERIDERGYARTVRSDRGHAVVTVQALEGEDALELRVRGAAPAALFQLSLRCATLRSICPRTQRRSHGRSDLIGSSPRC